MKKDRHALILRLIAENEVRTQDELQKLLLKHGVQVTQATLSRDIQQLSLVKTRDEKGIYRYALPPAAAAEKSLFAETVISVDYAGNMIVLKCKAGMAQGTCVAIDSVNHAGVVGTIAGDDTIFILARTEADAKKLTKKFKSELLCEKY